MKLFRKGSAIGIVTIVVTLFAWLGGSNHCALGLMPQANVEAQHDDDGCCEEHSAPSKKQNNSSDPQHCCKSLQIATPTQAKIPVGYDRTLFTIQAFFAALPSFPERPTAYRTLLEIDTGPPPDSRSFAEIVLQQSLRSHAPPATA